MGMFEMACLDSIYVNLNKYKAKKKVWYFKGYTLTITSQPKQILQFFLHVKMQKIS